MSLYRDVCSFTCHILGNLFIDYDQNYQKFKVLNITLSKASFHVANFKCCLWITFGSFCSFFNSILKVMNGNERNESHIKETKSTQKDQKGKSHFPDVIG